MSHFTHPITSQPKQWALWGFAFEGLLLSALSIGLQLAKGSTGLTSTMQLSAYGLAGLLILFLIGFSFRVSARTARIESILISGNRLLAAAITLGFLTIAATGLLAFFTAPAAYQYDTYSAWFNSTGAMSRFEALRGLAWACWPVLLWFAFLPVQFGAFLIAAYPAVTRRPGFLNWAEAGKVLLVLTVTTAAVAHWLILALELRFFVNIPGWYWEIFARPFQPAQAAFLILIAALLALGYWFAKHPPRTGAALALLVAAAYLTQLSFGLMDGKGFESLRLKFTNGIQRSYAMRAVYAGADPLKTVREYETLYGSTLFFGSKPPGMMVIYTSLGKAVNFFDPQPTANGRYEALTRFASYAFPLFAFLVLVALYFLSSRYLMGPSALFPSILYFTAPNILLLPLFLDQVLYPLLFTLGLLLAIAALHRGSFGLSILTGVYFFIAVFCSFSILPLLPLVLLLAGLDYLLRWQQDRRAPSLAGPLRFAGGLAGGIAVAYLVFWGALNYNFIVRFQEAMAVSHYTDYVLRAGSLSPVEGAGLALRIREVIGAFWLNNLDLAAGVGFPLYVFFLVGGIKTLAAWVRRKAGPREVLLGAYFLTYLVMNLYGQNRGETARLWMFWVPMVALFAGTEIDTTFRRKEWALVWILLLQLITAFLTFQFQDMWM